MKPKHRKSVFIVTYAIEKGKLYFLILKRKLHWKGWEFPKGGIERKERVYDAIKREIFEETGQRPLKIKNHKFSGKFRYHKALRDRPGIIGQTFSLYSAEIKKNKINFDKREHSTYKWLPFDKALKKLRWPNQKRALRKVDFVVKKDLNIY